ncbi:DUF4145 domain-containing protein [Paenibacillus sp. NPDC058367]|uniref:DUF4145 domain-containing protein n=1 Tax=Paenibacillus sp. NPDC058367 TaxID=3346460 RepID=UPI00364D3BF9
MGDKKHAKVYCKSCQGERNHESIAEPYERRSTHGDDIQWRESYYIAKCMGCETVAFIKQYGDEDMWEENEFGERDYITEYTVYPEKPESGSSLYGSLNLLSPKEFEEIPDDLLELYDQIIQVYNLKFHLLASFGLRTLIEAICKEVGVLGGTLFDKENKVAKVKNDGITVCSSNSLEGKIYGLYEGEYILWKHALILQKVRDVGNTAAHEIKTPSRKTVKDSISIVEKVLEDIYDLDKYKI